MHIEGRLWAEYDVSSAKGQKGVKEFTNKADRIAAERLGTGIRIPISDDPENYVVVDRASLASFELRNEKMDEETLALLPRLVQNHIHQLQKLETADTSEIKISEVRDFVKLMKDAHIHVPKGVQKFLLKKKNQVSPPEAIVNKLKKIIRKFSGKKVIVATIDGGAGSEASGDTSAVFTEPGLSDTAPYTAIADTQNTLQVLETTKSGSDKAIGIAAPTATEQAPSLRRRANPVGAMRKANTSKKTKKSV